MNGFDDWQASSLEVIRTGIPAAREADRLTLGCAQIAPVWLDRERTLRKVEAAVAFAAAQGCDLVCFGEALVPGYPFWLERTGGARFNDTAQKRMHALYLDQGVDIGRGDLRPLCELAAQQRIAVYLGTMERAADRGGHSLYCSLVFISREGLIGSVHRKLQPTYEERLAWAPGDGHGLRTHPLGPFRAGGLNCWENWMPLSRAALYAQGEDLHVSAWPGGLHNTQDLPAFLAREGRSYVAAVCGLMRPADIPPGTPLRDQIVAAGEPFLANGGTTIAAPDGSFLCPPVCEREALVIAHLDHARVREERQNFDPAGHYSRPDVTRLVVDRKRQGLAEFLD